MLTTRPGACLWCSATSWPLGRCPVKGSKSCLADRMIHFCHGKGLGAAFSAMCMHAYDCPARCHILGQAMSLFCYMLRASGKSCAQRPNTLRLDLPKAA